MPIRLCSGGGLVVIKVDELAVLTNGELGLVIGRSFVIGRSVAAGGVEDDFADSVDVDDLFGNATAAGRSLVQVTTA